MQRKNPITRFIKLPTLHKLAMFLTLAIYYGIFLGLYRLTVMAMKAGL